MNNMLNVFMGMGGIGLLGFLAYKFTSGQKFDLSEVKNMLHTKDVEQKAAVISSLSNDLVQSHAVFKKNEQLTEIEQTKIRQIIDNANAEIAKTVDKSSISSVNTYIDTNWDKM